MKRWIAALLALALAACLAWAVPAAAESGKDGAKQPAPEKASDAAEDAGEQEEEEDLDGLPRLGEETDTCAMVKLTNAAGADIVALCLKRSEDWAWSDSLLEEDTVLPAEESAVLCYEPPQEDGECEETASYELMVTLADEDGETMAVCHALALTDMEDAQLMRAWNGVLYVAYTSLETGEETDTAEAEQALAGAGGGQGAAGSEGCIGSAGLLN